MSFRQPFRSGLRDLAQGLLQQSQMMQQQSQQEAQMRQQMIAQQAEAQSQAGQMIGQGISQAAGMIGQGIQNQRDEQIRLSEQAVKDGRLKLDELIGKKGQLQALHSRGVTIENYDSIMESFNAYEQAYGQALAGDTADVFNRLSALTSLEVAPGVTGGQLEAMLESALINGSRRGEQMDLQANELVQYINETIADIRNLNPNDLVSVVRAGMAYQVLVEDLMPNYGDLLPKGRQRELLELQASAAWASFQANPEAQAMLAQAREIQKFTFRNEQNVDSQNTKAAIETFYSTGFINSAYEDQIKSAYELTPLYNNNGTVMTFDQAREYIAGREARVAQTTQELREAIVNEELLDTNLALTWKSFERKNANREELQQLVDSLVAAGNVSALVELSNDSDLGNLGLTSIVTDALSKASRVAQINELSDNIAIAELELVRDALPAERTAMGTKMLMEQATVLSPASLLQWWNSLPANEKSFYGGEANFSAAMRDARFLEYQRGNEQITVALQRLAPIINSPTTPENPEFSLGIIMDVLIEATNDPAYAASVSQAVLSAWSAGDADLANTLLRNAKLNLENRAIRIDVEAAEACMRDPSKCTSGVDVKELRLLLDSRRQVAATEHSGLMNELRANDCIQITNVDMFGLESARGGSNAGSDTCNRLNELLNAANDRIREIDGDFIRLMNAAAGLPQNSKPTFIDGGTLSAAINVGAVSFAPDFSASGQLDFNEIGGYVNQVLGNYNLSDADYSRLFSSMMSQIASSIMTESFVDYDGVERENLGPYTGAVPMLGTPAAPAPVVGPIDPAAFVMGERDGALRMGPAEAIEAEGNRVLPPFGSSGLLGMFTTPDVREVITPRLQAAPRFATATSNVASSEAMNEALSNEQAFLQDLNREISRSVIYETVPLSGGGTRQQAVPNLAAFSADPIDAIGVRGTEARRQNEEVASRVAVQLGFGSLEELAEYAENNYGIRIIQPRVQRGPIGTLSSRETVSDTVIPAQVRTLLDRMQRDVTAIIDERRRR